MSSSDQPSVEDLGGYVYTRRDPETGETIVDVYVLNRYREELKRFE